MKKYVLYGTGWKAEQFLYNFKYKNEIAYCLNTYNEGEFYGYTVYRWEDAPKDLDQYTIIVATVWKYYVQIRDLLKKRNLVEFHDFIYSDAFDRKIAVVNANCYGIIIMGYLQKSKSFMQKYCIWEVPPICHNERHCLPEEIMEICDLYIHQDIRADNTFGFQLSDEYVIPRLKEGCLKITIPNMVGMGNWCFPWCTGLDHVKDFGNTYAQMFWRDKLIDEAYAHCSTVAEIMEYMDKYCDDNYLKIEKQINQLFEKFWEKLKSREQGWDMKVSDYIKENYLSEKIFIDVDHPSGAIMELICKQLGNLLGINDIEDKEIRYLLDGTEAFTPEIVKKVLGIRFEEKYVREEKIFRLKYLTDVPMDRYEYIRQYIWWYYEKEIN